MREIAFEITGLGFILYSPPAVRHIPEGTDYLDGYFCKPQDVARHVMDGQLTAFCSGTPGLFRLRFHEGLLDDPTVTSADFKVRLGLEVCDGVICIRDLYDLQNWCAECPLEQQLVITDGWYLVTVYSSCPPSGILGDDQIINIHLTPVLEKPRLRWEGVPVLCA